MKRILITVLVLGMMLSAAACGGNTTRTTTDTDPTPVATTTGSETVVTPSANEGELKTGIYSTSIYYEGMGVTWNVVLTLLDDGTFTITDGTTEKGSGTYTLTDDCYTLSYADERIATFVVQKDGTLKMTSDFPYGVVAIKIELVGDIVFLYEGEIPTEGGDENEGNESGEGESDKVFTLAAGEYAVDYEKESAMGAVVYNYKATIGADGTFSYSVSFDMGGTVYDGASASGTYTLADNVFTFTDAEGNVTVGKVTADNVLNISLGASSMAKVPYEVNFAPVVYTLGAGEYAAAYEKVSPMAGTVVYDYKATVGADGTFSYSVSFDMGGTVYDGASASGTYTLAGNVFAFTDADGNVTEGKLTADDTVVIALKASDMAKEPYEVTFTVTQ